LSQAPLKIRDPLASSEKARTSAVFPTPGLAAHEHEPSARAALFLELCEQPVTLEQATGRCVHRQIVLRRRSRFKA